MSHDSDYLMALEMQKRLMDEEDSDIEEVGFKKPSGLIEISKQRMKIAKSFSDEDNNFLNCTQNLVHPQWETLDPTPDVYALFGQFDGKFFHGRLKCVTLEWSKRMYSCAGICYSRRNRFGMDVTIRLSEPLLKLRPRKDLIETLLHEMIHAFCFVSNIREGNGGHGPNFKKIMYAINKVAGTNITVYHTFHDEVNVYKQHWWRCNGMCQNRGPFFGYVKRTCNRAPGPNDNWFSAHSKSCGGTFMKIKSPEKPAKKKKEKVGGLNKGKENLSKTLAATGDLRKFLTPQQNNTNSNVKSFGNSNTFKGPIKSNGGGTMLLNPKTKTSNKTTTKTSDIAKAFPPSSYPGLSSDPFNVDLNSTSPGGRKNNNNTFRGSVTPKSGNLRNVVGFKDIAGQGSGESGGGSSGRVISGFKTAATSSSDWGRGKLLSKSNGTGNTSTIASPEGDVDKKHLRDLWSKRFGGGSASNNFNSADKRANIDNLGGDAKRRRISSDGLFSKNANGDVDFIPNEKSKDDKREDLLEPVITLISDDEDDEEVSYDSDKYKAKINKNMTIDERQNMIKQEIMDESTDLCDDDIELIDDEYDDDISLTTASELADSSIIEELFGEDTLLADFKLVNDSKPSSSKHHHQPESDIITCYICETKMPRGEYAEHLNGCEGISIKIQPSKNTLKKLSDLSSEDGSNSKRRSVSDRDILRNAGYTDDVIAQISSSEDTEEDEEFLNSSGVGSKDRNPQTNNSNAVENIHKSTIECPVCKKHVDQAYINDHLDICLLSQ